MIEKSRRDHLLIRIKDNSIARDNGCIEWMGIKTKHGYGLIHFARQWGEGWKASMTTSRAVYQAYYNVILERNQWVCHSCDNPSCVNIGHLFLGSPRDNSQDMIAKGRKAKKHKLHTRQRIHDDATINAIKNASGQLLEVAQKYGVSVSYVSRLRNGKAKTLIA
jgi:hypothetical protein